MSTPTRAFKGVWIPVEIWDSVELSWMEKCLLAEINSLDGGRGCYAGNDFLAERFKTSAGNIAKIISELRSKNFVEDVAFDGRTRWIRVAIPITKSPNQTLRFGKGRVSDGVNPDGPCSIEEKLKRDSLFENEPIKPPLAEKKITPTEDPNSNESLALALYKSYPRKVGKNNAIKAILKAMKDHSFDYLLERVSRYAACVREWPEDQLVFVPHPATWFNGGRFEDDESNWIKKAAPESFHHLTQKAFALRTAIQEHVANREYIGASDNPTPEQFADLRKLRGQLSEVEAKMASTRK